MTKGEDAANFDMRNRQSKVEQDVVARYQNPHSRKTG